MKMLTALLACTLFVATAAPTIAASFTHTEAGVEIAVPDGWKSESKDGALTLSAADGTMAVVFVVYPGDFTDKMIAEVEKRMEAGTGKITWEDKPDKEEVNGLEAEFWEGTAKDGKLQVEAGYIDTPKDNTLAYYWFDTEESETKHRKDIDTIMKGIKPLTK